MKIEPKNGCPLNGFQPCKQLDCAWFIQVRGQHPQTGQEVDEWACSLAWLPMLLIENAQQSRATGAAVESFRNHVVEANERACQALEAQRPIPRLIEG